MLADLPSRVAGLFEDALCRAEAEHKAGEDTTSSSAAAHGLADGGRRARRPRCRGSTKHPVEADAEAQAQAETAALALARAEVAEASAKARARAQEEAEARRRAEQAEREQMRQREAEREAERAARHEEAVRVKLAAGTRLAEQRWACVTLGIKQRAWRVWWRAMSEAKMQESLPSFLSSAHTRPCAAASDGQPTSHPPRTHARSASWRRRTHARLPMRVRLVGPPLRGQPSESQSSNGGG